MSAKRAVILTNLVVNGYPCPKGTLVVVAALEDNIALVSLPGCYFAQLDAKHLMLLPDDNSTAKIKRKSKTHPRKRRRK